MTKSSAPLMFAEVPYVTDRIPAAARRHLPASYRDPLSSARVSSFVGETDGDPETRLAVLSVLRMHSMNGAEVPSALTAIMLAALAILASVIAATSDLGGLVAWGFGVVATVAGGWFVRHASAAHVRRLTAGVWLAAYEDALRG